MRKILWGILFLSSAAIAAENASDLSETALGAGQNSQDFEALASPAKDIWKLALSSVYYDLVGTQAADNNAYSFGDVRVYLQMFDLERALNEDWKFVARLQYIKNDYAVVVNSKTYDEDTAGLGDTLVGVSHKANLGDHFTWIADVGLFLPTGSINEKNQYSTTNANYKYFMQLGSGTIDPLLALTAAYNIPWLQTGTKLSAVDRYGTMNANSYHLGNCYRADAWMKVPVLAGLTAEALGYYRLREPIGGGDPTLPLSAVQFYYHEQIDWAVSAGLRYLRVLTAGTSLALELGIPVQQGMTNSDHVVIATNYFGNVSLVGAF